MDEDEARRALETMRETQTRLADLGDAPLWRHAAFGAVMAMMVFSFAVPPHYQVLLVVLGLAGVALIARDDQRRYGVFVNGYRGGATRPVTFTLLGVVLVLGLAEAWARYSGLSVWSRIGIAAIAFAMTTAGSIAWSRVFRREMGRDA